jgi:hypothetical protein
MSIDPTLPLVPVTQLQAVNEMLRAVGRTEVSSLLTADMDQAAQGAFTALGTTSLEVQSRGWHFNTEEAVPVEPDTEGTIRLPTDVLNSRVNDRSADKHVTLRGNRMYDLERHTYVFDKPLYLDFIRVLDFEDLPHPVRWYVLVLAARKFAVGRIPDTNTFRFTKSLEDDALSAALQADQWSSNRTGEEMSPHLHRMRRR